MKKINKATILLFAIFALFSCENAPIEFDDYGVTTCYFPYQTPARTIILGKYDEGFNDNDNMRQFEIGVIMSGVYTNKEDRKVFFKLDTALLSNISNVKYLPVTHYTIETSSPVIIPKGDTKGRILIKLTDAFFADPKTVSSYFIAGTDPAINYAIPLLITGVEGLDSILVGKPLVGLPNPVRNTADWSILPKDYTLFGIKYINKYHGNYLRRGLDKSYNALFDTLIGSAIYRNQYVEKNELVKASTVDLNTITLPNEIREYSKTDIKGWTDGGDISLKLIFATDSTCTVYNNSTNLIIGSGVFKENGGIWGGKKHDAIFLNYIYTDATKNQRHEVRDTMVIRDRGVGFETFVPILKP